MEGWYLAVRAATCLLCLATAVLALRDRRRAPPGLGGQRLALALLMGAGAALSAVDGVHNWLEPGEPPVTTLSWAWFLFDLGVPALAIRVLRVTRQRDAALRRLTALAETDPLTALPNRRGFGARAGEALEAARRDGLPACVLLLDLDHFKAINDRHGHPAGDAVLVALAATLEQGLRRGDVPARLGGEEFAALLPGAALPDAIARAEALRQAIAAAVPHPAGGEARVTASFGVAPVGRRGLEAALAAADRALYAAKRNGRDRVEAAIDAPRLAGQSTPPKHGSAA